MVRLIHSSKSDILSDNGTACSITVLNTDCSIYGKYVAGFIMINEHGNTTFSKRVYQVVCLQN